MLKQCMPTILLTNSTQLKMPNGAHLSGALAKFTAMTRQALQRRKRTG